MVTQINLLGSFTAIAHKEPLAGAKKENTKETDLQEIKNIVEALLFASSEPLSFQKIRQIISNFFPIKVPELRAIIQQLETEYILQQRAFRLEAIAEGYVLRSRPEYHPYISLLFKSARQDKLSAQSLETLAIIAYKQPVTRVEIEAIRGVDSTGVVQHL